MLLVKETGERSEARWNNACWALELEILKSTISKANKQQPTTNILHPTPNEPTRFANGLFGVGCWRLDVGPADLAGSVLRSLAVDGWNMKLSSSPPVNFKRL